jgi:hypothetical protein
MRGVDERSGELFSYVDLEDRVPAQHPLRAIRLIVVFANANKSPRRTAPRAKAGMFCGSKAGRVRDGSSTFPAHRWRAGSGGPCLAPATVEAPISVRRWSGI